MRLIAAFAATIILASLVWGVAFSALLTPVHRALGQTSELHSLPRGVGCLGQDWFSDGYRVLVRCVRATTVQQ